MEPWLAQLRAIHHKHATAKAASLARLLHIVSKSVLNHHNQIQREAITIMCKHNKATSLRVGFDEHGHGPLADPAT